MVEIQRPNVEEVIRQITTHLLSDQKYGARIKTVQLSPEQQSPVDIDVVADLTTQEDKRGLGVVLRDLAEKYMDVVSIHFHQYGPKEYAPKQSSS